MEEFFIPMSVSPSLIHDFRSSYKSNVRSNLIRFRVAVVDFARTIPTCARKGADEVSRRRNVGNIRDGAAYLVGVPIRVKKLAKHTKNTYT